MRAEAAPVVATRAPVAMNIVMAAAETAVFRNSIWENSVGGRRAELTPSAGFGSAGGCDLSRLSRRAGYEDRVGDGDAHAVRAVYGLNLRIQLVGKGIDQAGTQPAFVRRPTAFGASHAIVGNGKF